MSTGAGAPLGAVLFDLDDTLVPQAAWLDGAFGAVAAICAQRGGLTAAVVHAALIEEASSGSARGGIIDRVVASHGIDVPVGELVAAFRAYRAETLETFPGVPAALADLRAEVPIGLVSDGDVGIQQAKLDASGLAGFFDVVVLSDSLGREFRKPSPEPYRRALDDLGVEPCQAAFVGDRPDTDVLGAFRVGMATVRVLTGEYADRPDLVAPTATVADAVAAVAFLRPLVGAVGGGGVP